MENHGQKRAASEQEDILSGVRVVLLDIEGTTTPITFVKDTLFPYVRKNVQSYLDTHFENDECQADIESLREQAKTDKEAKTEGVVSIPDKDGNQEEIVKAAVASVNWMMESDRKATALKQLQGHMWREAYKTGKVQGEVYDDVVPALQDWLDQDKKICVFSSGSVEAQKLLFGYSNKGDLSELFSGNFDTNIGSKDEKNSYSKIAEKEDVKASEVLFLTDLPTEAAAASEAGMKTTIVVRKGNAALTDEQLKQFNTITSFSELVCEEDGGALPPKKQHADGGSEDDDEDDDVEELDAEDVEEEDDIPDEDDEDEPVRDQEEKGDK